MLLGHADGVGNALVPEYGGLTTDHCCRRGAEREVGLNAPCAPLALIAPLVDATVVALHPDAVETIVGHRVGETHTP